MIALCVSCCRGHSKGIHFEGWFPYVNTTDDNEPIMMTTAMDTSVNLIWET